MSEVSKLYDSLLFSNLLTRCGDTSRLSLDILAQDIALQKLRHESGKVALEGTIKLFNPFHSRSDGRFTSGRSGASGGEIHGGSPSGELNAKQHAITQAKSKGSVIKTTGKILGLAGLGLVGFAVLSSVVGSGSSESFDEYMQKKEEDKQKRIEETRRKLDELTKNWPKYDSPEEAIRMTESALRGLGLHGIPDDLQLKVGPLPIGIGGRYDPNTKIFTLSPENVDAVKDGNPIAIWNLTHEIAHGNQEVSDTQVAEMSEIVGNDPNDPVFREYLEGQNDLMTAVAMTSTYGQKIDNATVIGMVHDYRKLNKDLVSAETGVSLSSVGEIITDQVGYPEEAKTWAAIATAKAERTGTDAKSVLVTAHANGFNGNAQHQLLVDLFPEEMASQGYYDTSGGTPQRKFPSMAEVRQWMANHNYTDPDKAYEQMLEEEAR